MDDDAGLRERYAEEIPVVLVDGVQRDFWKIDEVRLDADPAAGDGGAATSVQWQRLLCWLSDGGSRVGSHNATQWSR